MLRQRSPRIHDAAHLKFVRSQPCCACPKGGSRQSEAAHVRMECPARGKEAPGLAEKPSDCWTVPLCDYHHRTGIDAQHIVGEKLFWKLRGIDPFALASRLWVESGAAARALEPKRVKQPKPIADRKPRRMRGKIQSRSSWPQGRKLQSVGLRKGQRYDRG